MRGVGQFGTRTMHRGSHILKVETHPVFLKQRSDNNHNYTPLSLDLIILVLKT